MEHSCKSNEEMTSAFIANTCQLTPRSPLVLFDEMHNLMSCKSSMAKEYAVFCGSYAELYIRSLITCIDDVDVLIAQIDQLVYEGNIPVLPSDLSGLADTIECYKIEPCHNYPGFVRLRVGGEMLYNWNYKKYEFNYTADANTYGVAYLDSIADNYSPAGLRAKGGSIPNIVIGPAIKLSSDNYTRCLLAIDFVKSMWCPRWPKEAQRWLIRRREYGWPSTDTISDVVQNGCHFVYIQNRSCRDSELGLQWRFSFSVAEVILLQSWTHTQQIVYHLLRFFAKRELIHKNCPKEDEVLCTYHLKTLMLWTCEEKSPEWWNSTSLIKICSELFKMLAEWLKRRQCPNFFIPEANLFHKTTSSKVLDKIDRRLNEFCNPGILSNWFVENYILTFSRRHSELNVTMEVLPHYMLLLFEFRKVSQLESLDCYFNTAFSHSHTFSRSTLKDGRNYGLRQSFTTGCKFSSLQLKADTRLGDLPTVQNVSCFRYYIIQLYILHAANALDYGEISWDSSLFVELVQTTSAQPKIIKSTYHNFPKTYIEQSSRFQFLRAHTLMENLTGSNSPAELQLLCLMIKQFLTKALKYDVSISNGITPAALAYLAALHVATSEYQEATRLCLAVLMDKTSQENKETLNAGCLLFIDNVARIVGLCVLQKQLTVSKLAYINRRLYLDLRFSPNVFARHLIQVLSSNRMSKQFNLHYNFPDSLFPMDINLKVLIKPQYIFSIKSTSCINAASQIVYRRLDFVTYADFSSLNSKIVKERVLGALMEYALENMTSFYNVIRKDFGVNCNTIDCYRALILYKCRKNDEALHLCEQILKESDLQSDLKECSFANVLLVPPFDAYFDRDVQSLLGFHTLFHYLSPLNDDMAKIEATFKSTFECNFFKTVYQEKFELATLLACQYSVKCHYFLGRHFLARYLKARCCIDCNLPYSEALTELAALKTTLPFEHIIRRFLLRKLHRT